MFQIERRKKRQGRVCLPVRMGYASKARIFKFRFCKPDNYVSWHLLLLRKYSRRNIHVPALKKRGTTLPILYKVSGAVYVRFGANGR